MMQICLMNNNIKEMCFESKIHICYVQLRMEGEGITAMSFKSEPSFISFSITWYSDFS
jgi:hypothetical protein